MYAKTFNLKHHKLLNFPLLAKFSTKITSLTLMNILALLSSNKSE